MEFLVLILLEIVRTVVREVISYSIKVFATKQKNEKTTRKLGKSKRGGRSRH